MINLQGPICKQKAVVYARRACISRCEQHPKQRDAPQSSSKDKSPLIRIWQSIKFESLGQSLFVRHVNLPDDGEVLTEKEKVCDPNKHFCSDPVFVYETKCQYCGGGGLVRTSSKTTWGHRWGRGHGHQQTRSVLSTCPTCQGVGYLRRATARIDPEVLEDQEFKFITVGRKLSFNQEAKAVGFTAGTIKRTHIKKSISFQKEEKKEDDVQQPSINTSDQNGQGEEKPHKEDIHGVDVGNTVSVKRPLKPTKEQIFSK